MSTDRELLELAAKAAGLEFDMLAGKPIRRDPDGQPVYWNPLTDDGNALRLAVTLDFRVSPGLAVTKRNGSFGEGSTAKSADPYAATRRAIVRAAAAMVKL